jgi:D-alanyl-D-alanine carboxypeptidase/D-alanyl-D-alanine-endopeptidase (penicillin-binding protein 4)
MNRFLLSMFLGLFGSMPSVATAADNAVVRQEMPLDKVLGPILNDSALRGTEYGVQVVNVNTGEEVFARNADLALAPASVMKVLTAAVALRELGAGYRFSTYASSSAEMTNEGTLAGDLYVQGFGDPTLVTEDIWRLVYDLWLAGIRTIEGDVIFDDSHFDDKRLISGWRKDVDMANGPAYFAPLGALSVNFNTVCIVVGPGPETGQKASVLLETPQDSVKVVNEVKTGPRRSRPRFTIERTVRGRKRVQLKVSGSVPIGARPTRFYRSIADPISQFQAIFKGHLEDREIAVSGEYREDDAPDGLSMLARHESAPLPAVLARMNKHSSNFMAEHVLKAVGAEVEEGEGSTRNGLDVIQAYLESLGAHAEEFKLVNGSGLSRDALLRPSHVNSVLIDMAQDRVVGPEFLASLSIGGIDGTLWTRFRGEGIEGRVRGKTGSLNHVNALAAYVDGGDGELYAFTFFVNDIPGSSRAVRRLHSRFGRALLELK